MVTDDTSVHKAVFVISTIKVLENELENKNKT